MRAILVPVDGSPLAESAVPAAIALARRLGGARLEAVAVLPPTVDPFVSVGVPVLETQLDRDLRADTERYLKGLRGRVASMADDLSVSTSVVVGRPADAIVEYAERCGAELIVMTTHGRSGLNRFWLGSVAEGVVRHSPRPVLLLRESTASGATDFAQVLIPLDVSAESEQIVDDTIALAGPSATYHLLHVLVPRRWMPPPSALELMGAGDAGGAADGDLLGVTQESAMAHLAKAAERLRARGLAVETHAPMHHSAADAILAFARERGVGLIAMNTHARGAAGRALLGSVADKVMRGASVPVLLHIPVTKG